MFSKSKLILLVPLFIACTWMGYLYNVDFLVLHDTARLVVDGQFDRIYSDLGVNGSIGRYFYGPFSLVLFAPLGHLTYEAAKIFWLFLQCLSFWYFWKLLGQFFPWLNERQMSLAWFAVFVLAINPLHNNFQSNNIQLMLLVCLLGAEWLSRENAPRALWGAALLLVGSASVKIFPAFLLGFYWFARPKLRIPMVVWTIVTTILPVFFFGWETTWDLYRSFFKNLTTYSNENSLLKTEDICCLPSLLARGFHLMGISEEAGAPFIKAVVLGGTAAYLGLVFSRRKILSDNGAYLSALSLGLSLMTLLNPSTRPHYYIFYLPAAVLLFEEFKSKRLSKADSGLLFFAVVMIALTQEGVTGKRLNNLFEAWSLPTFGMLALCYLNIKDFLKR